MILAIAYRAEAALDADPAPSLRPRFDSDAWLETENAVPTDRRAASLGRIRMGRCRDGDLGGPAELRRSGPEWRGVRAAGRGGSRAGTAAGRLGCGGCDRGR